MSICLAIKETVSVNPRVVEMPVAADRMAISADTLLRENI